MSYILKALARSERERQRLRSPDLRDVLDSAGGPQKRRRTGLLLFLFLSANTLLLGAILFMRGQGGDPQPPQVSVGPIESPTIAATAKPPGNPAPVSLPEPEAVAAPPTEVAATRARPEPLPPVAPATRPLLLEAQPPSQRVRAAPIPTAAPPIAAAEPVASTPDVDMAGVERVDSLPGIEITVHVYADDPEQRFAYVNGTRYVEGDTLSSGGARLEHITKDGIIVDLGNRRALLSVRR